MNIIAWAKARTESRIARLVSVEVNRSMQSLLPLISQLIEFHNSPREDRQSYHDHTRDPLGNSALFARLKDRLLAVGVPVEEVDIDISDFESWLSDFSEFREHCEDEKYYDGGGALFIEKCLEHYLSFRYLKICEDDVYIDIAAATSPWALILRQKGIKAYRLDRIYPKGIHGVSIGADVGATELPDGFASALSSQCAYEMFEGDADVLFLREAARILDEKGRYGIVPLYLDDTYFLITSPYCNQQDVRIEPEAKRVWRDDNPLYKLAFHRHYSPEGFERRIYSNIPVGMIAKVLYFRNLSQVMKHYPGQRIYCFFMFISQKKS